MSLHKKTLSGLFWSYAQQFSAQLINFVISMVLARLLLPEDFGVMGLIYVFIGIGTTLVDSGLSQSLIRTQNATQEDYSTVFFTNLFLSILVYAIVYIAAPYIAAYYDLAILTNIIRVFSLTFIISAFSAVQNAVLTKQLMFKTQMIIAIPSLLVSGVVGITLAYLGFGVWSLVWAGLSKAFFGSLQLWFYQKWSPTFSFNKLIFKKHFHFGYKLTLIGIMNTFFTNIYPIIIGKTYSISQVGLYTQAETLKQLPVSNISGAITNVTFPLFSMIQDNNEKLKETYRKITVLVLFIVSPILIYMSVLAKPLLIFLYSDKWVAAAPFLTILCYSSLLPIVNAYNINILKAKGKSNYLLKTEIFNKIVLVALIFMFLNFGIYGLIWSKVFSSIFSFVINSYLCGKVIHFSLFDQFKSFIPIIVLGTVSGVVVFFMNVFISSFGFSPVVTLVVSSFSGLLVYLGLTKLFLNSILIEISIFIKKVKNQ